ncbi:MAG TPA: hypothetical protein VEZ43_01445 [Dongiaceae bacterium]|nr:hypothetical protein [Dongiaceae bacterium]
MIVAVPRFCPICKEQLWSDEQLMDPGFYRQRHAQQYYQKHTTLKHPEFAKWDRKIQRYYAAAMTVDGVSFILFFGLADYFPGPDTLIFGLFFVASLVLSSILVLIGQKRKKNFRDSWKKEHPFHA